MKSIGIDIGASQIKVVEIQTTSKGYVVNQYLIHQLSLNPNHDREIETIEFLRDLASKYDAADTRYCVALRQEQVAIRNKIFPFTDRLTIAKTLPMELEDDIPFSIENSIFDSKIIRTLGTSSEILACASPKHHVAKMVQLLNDSGIEPEILSTEGSAFANLFERWNEAPRAFPASALGTEDSRPTRNLRIVLNIGYARTLVCAFDDSSLIGVRSLLWGGKNIAESIAKKYEIPLIEATKEMELKAFILTTKQETSYDAKIFSDTIAKSVREMVRDLQLSLLEFRSEFNGNIQQVELTGGVSLIQGLGPFLTQQLEVPVNRIRILDHIPQILFEKTDITDSRLGVALGLAIEGLKRPRNPAINFLKNEFAKQNHRLRKFVSQWGLSLQFAAVALVMLYVWGYFRSDFATALVDKANERLKEKAVSVGGLTKKTASEANVRKKIKENRKIITEIKSTQSVFQMNSALEILKRISESAPDKNAIKIDLKKFHVIEDEVTLEGYLNSRQEATNFMQSLNSVSADGRIQSRNSTLPADPKKVAISVSFKVDRNIHKAGL